MGKGKFGINGNIRDGRRVRLARKFGTNGTKVHRPAGSALPRSQKKGL